jgi:hypothetical protein
MDWNIRRAPIVRDQFNRPLDPLTEVSFIDFPWGQFAQELDIQPGPPTRDYDLLVFSWVLQIIDTFDRYVETGRGLEWYRQNYDDLVKFTYQLKAARNRRIYPFMLRLLEANGYSNLLPKVVSRSSALAQ